MKSTNIGSILYTLLKLLPSNLYLLIILVFYLALSNINISSYDITQNENRQFQIELKGEVVNPGIYNCDLDTSLSEVLSKAILTENADTSGINLSAKIRPEAVIVIPSKNDSYKVSINTATIEELTLLDGIKEAMALRIIDYRQANGGFKSLEELMNVKGIGTSKFNKIKDKIKL